MIVNQYVGELMEDVDLAVITKNIKDDVRKAKLSSENIKTSVDNNNLYVLCTGDIANVIRKRTDIKRFRCNVIAYHEKIQAEKRSKKGD